MGWWRDFFDEEYPVIYAPALAPEQTERGNVTPSADVWAIGLIGFFLLTGLLGGGDGIAGLKTKTLRFRMQRHCREAKRFDERPGRFSRRRNRSWRWAHWSRRGCSGSPCVRCACGVTCNPRSRA